MYCKLRPLIAQGDSYLFFFFLVASQESTCSLSRKEEVDMEDDDGFDDR